MEFILSMQMLQEFENPDIPFPPPPLEGIDNAVFQHHTGAPLPPPLPSASALDRPGSPVPPPPYSALDRPPEYSTLPRVVTTSSSAASSHSAGANGSHAPVQGTRRQRGAGVAQGILQRQSNSSSNSNSGNSRRSYRYSPRDEECPAYNAPSLGSSWNTHASSSTTGANHGVTTSGAAQTSSDHGHLAASRDVSRRISDDCDGYSDISSVSCPRRSNVHRV